jgi:hypothetical protein
VVAGVIVLPDDLTCVVDALCKGLSSRGKIEVGEGAPAVTGAAGKTARSPWPARAAREGREHATANKRCVGGASPIRSFLLKARNGVGVRADGKVIFAISQGEESFDAFARLFRDGLNCPNALSPDGGSAASLYAPLLNSHGNIVSLGPMLAVFERNRGASRQ